jgi:hypothetical protein
VAVMAVGLAGLGCGAQQLGGGPQRQRDGGAPSLDAGCPPLGKMVCMPAIPGCSSLAPVCLNGAWTCPPNAGYYYGQTCEPPLCDLPLPSGCSCDTDTGAVTCRDAGAPCPGSAPDGSIIACVASCSDTTALSSVCTAGVWSCPTGTVDVTTCGRADAGTSCPAYGQDGGLQSLSCVYSCSSDTGVNAICVSGTWQCPAGAFSTKQCPRFCSLSPPPPPGCMCNPMNGILTCESDAGAGGHGG